MISMQWAFQAPVYHSLDSRKRPPTFLPSSSIYFPPQTALHSSASAMWPLEVSTNIHRGVATEPAWQETRTIVSRAQQFEIKGDWPSRHTQPQQGPQARLKRGAVQVRGNRTTTRIYTHHPPEHHTHGRHVNCQALGKCYQEYEGIRLELIIPIGKLWRGETSNIDVAIYDISDACKRIFLSVDDVFPSNGQPRVLKLPT